MTTRKTLALSLAALFLSATFAVTAQAATNPHRAATHHRSAKAAKQVSHKSKKMAGANADHSADSLNAQSLSRAQAGPQ